MYFDLYYKCIILNPSSFRLVNLKSYKYGEILLPKAKSQDFCFYVIPCIPVFFLSLRFPMKIKNKINNNEKDQS